MVLKSINMTFHIPITYKQIACKLETKMKTASDILQISELNPNFVLGSVLTLKGFQVARKIVVSVSDSIDKLNT